MIDAERKTGMKRVSISENGDRLQLALPDAERATGLASLVLFCLILIAPFVFMKLTSGTDLPLLPLLLIILVPLAVVAYHEMKQKEHIFTFDRSSGVLLRDGKVLCSLDRIEDVQIVPAETESGRVFTLRLLLQDPANFYDESEYLDLLQVPPAAKDELDRLVEKICAIIPQHYSNPLPASKVA